MDASLKSDIAQSKIASWSVLTEALTPPSRAAKLITPLGSTRFIRNQEWMAVEVNELGAE
jgi:hypothetical protein